MTKATAQTVAGSLIDLGYQVKVYQPPLQPTQWVVEVEGDSVNVQAVASFAQANSITGRVDKVSFI